MASRKEQKEAARARRLAAERERQERERRTRRLQMLGGVVVIAVVIVGVAIAISAGGTSTAAPKPDSPAAKQSAALVSNLLQGIPQSGTTLGSSSAKVTVTEFGDLECPICKDFALGAEQSLISNEVRNGKVKLVYRSLPTATGNGPDPSVFPVQQAAAYAAGMQNYAWNYILLFYHQQGSEDTSYVTPDYLQGLAQQITGLNYSKWQSDRASSTLTAQVTSDEQAAHADGFDSTPTILVSGPKGQAQPLVGDQPYSTIQSAIKSVS
jgi:protein-disulfide isomerase